MARATNPGSFLYWVTATKMDKRSTVIRRVMTMTMMRKRSLQVKPIMTKRMMMLITPWLVIVS